MIDLRERVYETLKQGHTMSLGTLDEQGIWVAAVTYSYDEDFNLYWISSPTTRHSQALLTHPQVAATITISANNKDPNLGLQIAGNATKIDGPRYDLAKRDALKRGKPEPLEGDDILAGRSWYMLKPTQIELIDQLNFGFKRQTFLLN